MSKAVVVLSPNNGCQEDVERGDLDAPLHLETLFEPLAVLSNIVSNSQDRHQGSFLTHLVDHGVDDVDKRLVAVQQAVATTQNVALQPSLTGVLR